MAKPISYQEIEKRLSVLKEGIREADIPYVLLGAFGTTDALVDVCFRDEEFKDSKVVGFV